MAVPINDLAALKARLAALPPPAEGRVRVYRGQPVHYPKMLANAFRPGATQWERLWGFALKPFAENLIGRKITDDVLEYISYTANWFKAVTQHYGPGSRMLDVTKSIEVALWFALHQARSNLAVQFAISQEESQFPVVCPTLHFSPSKDGNGWIYVLDAPAWEGTNLPKHGELVDLGEGPELIARSPRVQRQVGCLVAGEEKIGGGDLSGLWACEPIPVALPFTGAPLIDREATYLFPPPEEDEWYARLLGAPLIPQPDQTFGYAYTQSLGVYLVPRDESPESAAPFIDRQARSVRALTRLALRTENSARELRKIVGAYPEAATYVCLECPLLTLFPGARTWNQSVLFSGLERTVEPEDAVSGAVLPEVSLENVLLEFSPLEWEFRATPGGVDYAPRQCRAAWLVRRESAFRLTLFTTEGATPGFEMAIHRIEYSEREHAFGIVDREGRRTPIVDNWASQPFFVMLALLRHLSRSVKPEAIPDMIADDKCFVQVRGPVTKLVRPTADDLDLRLHFVRRLDTGARYEGPLPVSEGSVPALLCLDASTPFDQLHGLERVYGQVRRVDFGGRVFRFDGADATGHSAEAAATLMRWFPGTLRKEAGV